MNKLSRRQMMGIGGGAALSLMMLRPAKATTAYPPVTAFRNPGCDCCGLWAESMKKAGFAVTMTDDPALVERRAKLGVPTALAGCHLAFVGNYILEGHVPPEDVISFLAKTPDARGLAVPGMPMGSPGMEMGGTAEPYEVLLFTADGKSQVYAKH